MSNRLSPKHFAFTYNGFNYEGVSVDEYKDNNTLLGNYVVILLSPSGTETFTVYPTSDEFIDTEIIEDEELRGLIIREIL